MLLSRSAPHRRTWVLHEQLGLPNAFTDARTGRGGIRLAGSVLTMVQGEGKASLRLRNFDHGSLEMMDIEQNGWDVE